ncbi:hypothetical protein ACQRD0_07715 [Streptococcus alactolyticus]
MSNIFLVGANFGKDVSKDFIKKESGNWGGKEMKIISNIDQC